MSDTLVEHPVAMEDAATSDVYMAVDGVAKEDDAQRAEASMKDEKQENKEPTVAALLASLSPNARQKLLTLKIRLRMQQLQPVQRRIAERVVKVAPPFAPPAAPPRRPMLPPPPSVALLDPMQFLIRRPLSSLLVPIPSLASLLPPRPPPQTAAQLLARMPVEALPWSVSQSLQSASPAIPLTSAVKARRDVEQAELSRKRGADEDRARQREAARQRKLLRKHFLNAVKAHREQFLAYHKGRLKAQTAMARAASKNQEVVEKRRRAMEEKSKRDRMKALKENDMTEYVKLLEGHKNDRLTSLLAQTDSYLKELGKLIRGETSMEEAKAPKPYIGKGNRRWKRQQEEREAWEKLEREAGRDTTLSWAEREKLRREEDIARREREDQEAQDQPVESEGAAAAERPEYKEDASMAVDDKQAAEAAASEERVAPKKDDNILSLSKFGERISHQPKLISGGTLKGYQLKGLEWMVSLYNSRLNGILADEMGLGKTVQTIALFAYLLEKKNNQGPFLCVVPLSTLNNWLKEFTRFAPLIRCVVYHGTRPTRHQIWTEQVQKGEFHVLLTTYDFIINRKDTPKLGSIAWEYIVVDEGHRMKNAESKLTLTLSTKYSSQHRLILTGTPLQNSLKELWSLLNFLLPNIFNSSENFEDWFNKPFESAGLERTELDEEEKLLIINRLHQVLRPFLLRRLKSEVADQLPEKVECVLKCELSAWQSLLYNQIKNKALNTVDKRTGELKRAKLANTFVQLRKVCNHPYLFAQHAGRDWATTVIGLEIVRCSGKFALLHRMLPKLLRAGHRVLIFCQMTRVMDIMEEYFEWRHFKWLRLDGNNAAAERNAALDAFNAPDSEFPIFLLSTRAGGLGLNLQTADTVIIYDSDWNPQMDIQAQDRAHRVGQKKEVRVFRLISISPVEEGILERARYKLSIDQVVIQSGMFNAQSSADERKNLLQTLLREGIKYGSEVRAPSDAEINTMMARTEEEIDLFTQIDAEIEEEDKAAWKAEGKEGDGPPGRLMIEEEVPHFIRNAEELLESQKEPEQELGRGGKGRVSKGAVSYAEELTDREFERALERGEDPYEVVLRKQERRILIEQGVIVDPRNKKRKKSRKLDGHKKQRKLEPSDESKGEADEDGAGGTEDGSKDEDGSGGTTDSSTSSDTTEDDNDDSDDEKLKSGKDEQSDSREDDSESADGQRAKAGGARGRGRHRGRGRARGRGRLSSSSFLSRITEKSEDDEEMKDGDKMDSSDQDERKEDDEDTDIQEEKEHRPKRQTRASPSPSSSSLSPSPARSPAPKQLPPTLLPWIPFEASGSSASQSAVASRKSSAPLLVNSLNFLSSLHSDQQNTKPAARSTRRPSPAPRVIQQQRQARPPEDEGKQQAQVTGAELEEKAANASKANGSAADALFISDSDDAAALASPIQRSIKPRRSAAGPPLALPGGNRPAAPRRSVR